MIFTYKPFNFHNSIFSRKASRRKCCYFVGRGEIDFDIILYGGSLEVLQLLTQREEARRVNSA